MEIPTFDFTRAQHQIRQHYPHQCCEGCHPQSQLFHLTTMKIPAKNTLAREQQKALQRLSREICTACPPFSPNYRKLWQEEAEQREQEEEEEKGGGNATSAPRSADR